MNLTQISLVVIFILYDAMAAAVIYWGYGEMVGNIKNPSVIDKVILAAVATIVGILWLPVTILSLVGQKIHKAIKS